MSKKYWRGLPELHDSPEFQAQQKNEFAEPLPMDEFLNSNDAEQSGTSRRDFLKIMGFSTAAVALAACETPVNRAIPYVVKPEEVTPGVANFYATTFYDGHDYSAILVKTREGRPIKIEGNDLKGLTHSGTNARVQASVLGLYDGARLRGPVLKGQPSTWKSTDDAVAASLKNAGAIRILTSTIISPSTKSVISGFISKYPTAKHITYDSISYNALTKANQNVFGKNVVSSYDFSKAKVVAAIACDFLGNWLSGEEFSRQYAVNRRVSKANPEMSQHFHFESNMSLTGANADYRYMVKPSELGRVTVALFNEVASATGNAKVNGDVKVGNTAVPGAIKNVAAKLVANKGQSLVVSGVNDEGIQTLVNGINKMLDNYGKTIDVENHMNLKQGNDAEFAALVRDMAAGNVNVLMTFNCNPIYTAPASLKFGDAYKKVATKISFAPVMDETAKLADIICPDHHYLESWGDYSPKQGMITLQQPVINPVFAQPHHEGTRQFQNSILKWSGVKSDYLAYLQGYWNNVVFPMQSGISDFPSFWAQALHDGAVSLSGRTEMSASPMAMDSTGRIAKTITTAGLSWSKDADKHSKETHSGADNSAAAATAASSGPADYSKAAATATSLKGGGLELFIYEKISIGNGNYSNNPWLMELPDPISKVTWDNYITMSPVDVKEMGLHEMLRQDIDGSIVDLTVNGITMKVPVYPQPGQAPGSIGLALGYGRNANELKVAHGVGVNAFPLLNYSNGTIQPIATNVSIAKTHETHMFAATQIQHTIMGREEFLLREVSLKEFKKHPKEYWNPPVELAVHGGGKKHVNDIDLWAAFPRPGHKWGMSVDLNLCFGCGACVVACTAENNVAVVGKLEVSRVRDMHWLRIDRYYTSDMNLEKGKEKDLGSKETYIEMENPSANPQVTFQPMMCQHCNHAPCETVCPVLATSHSTEGLNMMTYNRCIGTRYCANNCPFKVRRFNWFNYSGNDHFADVNPAQQELGRMVLNPDVVVRSRGVMEKCSMCQQRLQAGKLEAKKAGTPIKDGTVKTACQAACSTGAIMFGDLNDTESVVAKDRLDERAYFLLEDLGIKPSSSYMVKVRNQDEPIIRHGAAAMADGQKKTPEKHS
jgi:molybdopterin-containing oxidoreductase family iron-sulfur binding subunit